MSITFNSDISSAAVRGAGEPVISTGTSNPVSYEAANVAGAGPAANEVLDAPTQPHTLASLTSLATELAAAGGGKSSSTNIILEAIRLMMESAREQKKSSHEIKQAELSMETQAIYDIAEKIVKSGNIALVGAIVGGVVSIAGGAFSMKAGAKNIKAIKEGPTGLKQGPSIKEDLDFNAETKRAFNSLMDNRSAKATAWSAGLNGTGQSVNGVTQRQSKLEEAGSKETEAEQTKHSAARQAATDFRKDASDLIKSLESKLQEMLNAENSSVGKIINA
ncbi:hypothetical protein H0A36_09825 [Endozoicomonas sp. SM1973]|uniref:Uncharacterized protein n=1 Tax=Spartinivicinus marinus TaxID=2994442 RepID=A0A853I6L1_9GAMM|nr:hypothetical protein [Spartinivicinus marinus]MCX4024665.1 hypothetical protein [Spartinivicinus marinus]NYZ66308.1 hypothetical protein [Spartinivicinus marinus]